MVVYVVFAVMVVCGRLWSILVDFGCFWCCRHWCCRRRPCRHVKSHRCSDYVDAAIIRSEVSFPHFHYSELLTGWSSRGRRRRRRPCGAAPASAPHLKNGRHRRLSDNRRLRRMRRRWLICKEKDFGCSLGRVDNP